jgi:hypothetical protein
MLSTALSYVGKILDCGNMVSMIAISNYLEKARELFDETHSYLIMEALRRPKILEIDQSSRLSRAMRVSNY